MIDIIKGLFKIGDKINLICTDKSKIEGTIMNITDEIILLKDKDNLIKGVKSTMIEYFEQPTGGTVQGNSTGNTSKRDLKIIDKIPLETLLQKDPRLKKRFPNLAKEQDAKTSQFVAPTTPKQDTPYYIDNVDKLIRRTKIDEAINYIDAILNNGLTPTKTKSALLLKKAQVLSAQNRQSEAAKAYEALIELNKRMGAAGNNISHLYTELARLQLLNADTAEKASESISMALKYNRNNDAARNLLAKIENSKSKKIDADIANELVIDVKDGSLVPSVMIVTDIKEHKYADPKIINTRQITAQLANDILSEAKKSREVSKSQSFLMFLEAAKVYSELPVGSYDYQDYLSAMAYYAMLKADSLYAKYKNYSHTTNADVKELEMLKDSACSYYRESLNLVSDVTPESLVAIVTNYLKLEIAQQQAIKGQRTYYNGDLKAIFYDCIVGGNAQLKAAAIRMLLSCGAASLNVWNTICQDGIIGSILTNKQIRSDLFDTINFVGGTDIDKSQRPKEFFKQAFALWRNQEQELLSCVNELEFNVRLMSSISQKWADMSKYDHLFLPTDMESKKVVDSILNILSPYLNRNQVERTNLLISSQRLIDSQIRFIENHTTYLGRAFFFLLFEKWKKEIDDLISDKIAKSYPAMNVVFDPPFYINSENGRIVHLTIQNIGETTAEGCFMNLKVESDKVDVNKLDETLEMDVHQEIPSGAKMAYELFVPKDVYPKAKVLYLSMNISPIYLGKRLEPNEFSSTIEEEASSQLTYDDILWKDGPIPANNLFKGRQEDIQNLSQHYLSVEKDKPYILYGLTRTGKSSILKFLKEDIEGNTFRQENREMIVCPVKWEFSEAALFDTKEDFWDYLINGTLMENLYAFAVKYHIDISDIQVPDHVSARDLSNILNKLNGKRIYPLFLVDEFSYVKSLIDNGIVRNAFLHTLRQYSLEGLASFLFAGTYDIKALIKDPKYGITGQLVNAISKQVNEIKPKDAEELMNVMSDQLRFTPDAVQHIHQLSGDIPYFIQIICKYCGYYASDFKRSVIGYPELEKVVEILAGEKAPYQKTLLAPLTEYTFQNNQYSPQDPPEVGALISSIVYFNQDDKLNPRGVSSDEIERLWVKNGILNKQKLYNAFQILMEKRVLVCKDDDGLPTYSLAVDLFRRWWTVAHPDFNLDMAELKQE